MLDTDSSVTFEYVAIVPVAPPQGVMGNHGVVQQGSDGGETGLG